MGQNFSHNRQRDARTVNDAGDHDSPVNQSTRKPFRDRCLGWIVTLIGLAICFPGVIAFHTFWSLGLALFRASPLVGVLDLLVIVCSAYIGAMTLLIGKRLRAPAEVVSPLAISPDDVLYLRPFSDDKPGLFDYAMDAIGGLRPRTREEALVSALSRIGPVKAVGSPCERLPTLGATRIYVDHQSWRNVVADWITRAKLIVVSGGDSDGIAWETQVALELSSPNKIVFYLPAVGRKAERAKRYNLLRQRIIDAGFIGLPEKCGKAHFICVTEYGQSQLLSDSLGFILYPKFVRALLPVYARFSIHLPRKRLIVTSILLWLCAAAMLVAFPFAIVDQWSRWFP